MKTIKNLKPVLRAELKKIAGDGVNIAKKEQKWFCPGCPSSCDCIMGRTCVC